jgi:regulator of protease activity HflC (stomatin/prohibitin superfamily)
MRYVAVGGAAVGGLIGLSVLLGSWYTVDQTQRGVILRNGRIIGTAGPGLGFKVPLADDVEKISVTEQITTFEELAAYSNDQQPVTYRLSINWLPDPSRVDDIYGEYKSLDGVVSRIINPVAPQESKVIFGQFTAQSAVQKRAELNTQVADRIAAAIAARKGPLTVKSVQVENIDFSDAYEKSIEDRMLAEVNVQKENQNWEREKVLANIKTTQAKATADSNLAIAKAKAEATRIEGEAEASAIRVKQEALSQSPNYVSLVQAEKWNGVLPTTMVPGSAVPFVSVK